ncbi:MAG: TrmJ/YjtD family RNA methyltransferase [Deltaproteobacteria bacterium]|nr:TrmJ/YjtD family RNA methyltransferase [Deltaproteobacteria bacterium]
MMTASFQSMIDFVLVRPQYAGNAGAAARALKNTGFKKMIWVNPAFTKDDPDLKFSVGARDLVQRTIIHDDFLKAIGSYRTVIGTSRREGAYRKNIIDLYELPNLVQERSAFGKIAILFGTEADGLSSDELEQCQYLVNIPANPDFSSLNLAQAVLLTAYELYRSQIQMKPRTQEKYPSSKDLEGMYSHLTEMLLEIGFMRKTTLYHMPRILRNIFNRAELTDAETRVIRGICRQVLWYKNSKTKG